MTDAVTLEQQTAAAVDQFTQTFGQPPTHAAVAPGRVNLIGEHTDYNDGFVLPMAIERQILLLARPRDDRKVRLASTGVPEQAELNLDQPLAPGEPSWANYVRGAIAGCIERGLTPPGFDALVDSTVPTGGGLSSSAALEVGTATLLESLTGQPLDPVQKALLCQKAEHDFAGMPCGIMDQFISAMGMADHALLIDCRSYETRRVPMHDPDVVVLIVNSNVKHELVGGEYAQRRAQCEAAARTMNVPALRDATLDMLDEAYPDPSDVAFRRARHVITENARTLAAAEALAAGDWAAMGQLMLESHTSMRDDFEISCKELDILVELATRRIASGELYGSRMTGGGFGGCTVSLVRADAADAVGKFLAHQYEHITGIHPALFVTRPAAGARVVEL
ncbi:galactokinase [Phycisphaerales bacterium AB-hyl4]|uniref:Galactokinase n=1 Tax=Natronomicrosphaera hydrolytica TaxID=3242702 RepID=A0ABV4U222_9BACT